MCRNRIDSEEKLQTVRLILNGKESLRHAAERLDLLIDAEELRLIYQVVLRQAIQILRQ